MLVYAHRGWHGPNVAENSMAAFARAAAAGCGIETDLRITRDRRLILFHDRTAVDAAVASLTHAELEAAKGRAIPLLETLLAAALPVELNLEVKTRAAWTALQPFLADLPRSVLISSFIHPIAVAAANAGFDSALLLASHPAGPDLLPPPQPRLSTAVWDVNVVDAELPLLARALGWRTIVYGPATVAEHDALTAIPVDGIITDTPDRVRGLRARATV
ncbi:glycerophosphodiester phosphodiesterase [Sphingomonas sp. NPDC079357]|uniref:glycerophosphodiester phosphodiesterase n=1 Tax=Sphingomonas sp. NPDC079357 TaxID=3364518 RepID=UPI00384A890D